MQGGGASLGIDVVIGGDGDGCALLFHRERREGKGYRKERERRREGGKEEEKKWMGREGKGRERNERCMWWSLEGRREGRRVGREGRRAGREGRRNEMERKAWPKK